MTQFSHLDRMGRAKMVDISGKNLAARRAVAKGTVLVSGKTVELLRKVQMPKGDPLETARLAGIQAAKQASLLIPLCHPLNLDFVDVQIELAEQEFRITSEVKCRWATGVEMEALTAVAVAALTLYDMCKSVDKKMRIMDIHLVVKAKQPIQSNRTHS